MSLHLSTAGIAPGERFDYWNDRLRETFRADIRVRPLDETPLEVETRVHSCGPTIVVETCGSTLSSSRRSDPGTKCVNLLLNLEGHCVVRQDNREIELAPGHYGMFPIGECAEYDFHGPFRHLSVLFAEDQLNTFAPAWRNCSAMPLPLAGEVDTLFVDFLRALLRRNGAIEGPQSRHIADSTTSLLAAMLETHRQGQPDSSQRFEQFHRERIRRFISSNLRNPELNMEMISVGVRLSPRYIHRLFSGDGPTPMEWVREQRLERTANDLADSTAPLRPISCIAYSWGFNDAAHFSRIFRKRYGVTPREYRDGNR